MTTESFTVAGDVDPRGLATVQQLLDDQIIQSAWYGASTDSTNTVGLNELKSNHDPQRSVPHRSVPRLILADQQTSGRGRHGRRWISSNQTLTFTLVIDGPRQRWEANLLSLAVGVSIARCLESEFGPLETSLKWPNDIYIGGGKVAGILLETSANETGRLVVGVGVNVGTPPEIPDSGAAVAVCSLSKATGRSLLRYDCLYALVRHLIEAVQNHDQVNSHNDVISQFRSRCTLTGKVVQFRKGDRQHQGVCRGIDDDGGLLIEIGDKTETLCSGDVQQVRQRRIP